MTEPPIPQSNPTVAEWLRRARDEGDLYPNPSSHQCRVCREPLVMGLVNQMISVGYTLPDIVNALAAHNRKLKSEGKAQVTYNCVRRHRDRHFDIQSPAAAIYRQIQEKRAVEHGQDWESGVGTILNFASYLETVALRGYEHLINPDTNVHYTEGAKAMLTLHELARKDEDAFEVVEMRARMARVIKVVREFVPPEQWPALQASLLGEEVERPKAAPVQSVRVIDIDDTPDLEE